VLAADEALILDMVQRNQHGYCAPVAQLSTHDLVDIFDQGSLEGGDRLTLTGYDRCAGGASFRKSNAIRIHQGGARGRRQTCTSRPSGRLLRSAVVHSVARRIQAAGS
jgi:hypothetical protein